MGKSAEPRMGFSEISFPVHQATFDPLYANRQLGDTLVVALVPVCHGRIVKDHKSPSRSPGSQGSSLPCCRTRCSPHGQQTGDWQLVLAFTHRLTDFSPFEKLGKLRQVCFDCLWSSPTLLSVRGRIVGGGKDHVQREDTPDKRVHGLGEGSRS